MLDDSKGVSQFEEQSVSVRGRWRVGNRGGGKGDPGVPDLDLSAERVEACRSSWLKHDPQKVASVKGQLRTPHNKKTHPTTMEEH